MCSSLVYVWNFIGNRLVKGVIVVFFWILNGIWKCFRSALKFLMSNRDSRHSSSIHKSIDFFYRNVQCTRTGPFGASISVILNIFFHFTSELGQMCLLFICRATRQNIPNACVALTSSCFWREMTNCSFNESLSINSFYISNFSFFQTLSLTHFILYSKHLPLSYPFVWAAHTIICCIRNTHGKH